MRSDEDHEYFTEQIMAISKGAQPELIVSACVEVIGHIYKNTNILAQKVLIQQLTQDVADVLDRDILTLVNKKGNNDRKT
jgi:hypothetical protein